MRATVSIPKEWTNGCQSQNPGGGYAGICDEALELTLDLVETKRYPVPRPIGVRHSLPEDGRDESHKANLYKQIGKDMKEIEPLQQCSLKHRIHRRRIHMAGHSMWHTIRLVQSRMMSVLHCDSWCRRVACGLRKRPDATEITP
jgi:hypothetical protein